ncbi:MAG TPA: hypothetical protein VNA69_19720 [Thermoanaerobaculia bacterium]|nr:hypothetical protein [Thermoanaerobaculia bacterium]
MGDLVWIDGNYEVVRAVCPSCGVLNVYNRRSDLGNLSHIAHLRVGCQEENCQNSFAIGADDAGPAYRTAFYDSSEFMRGKRYALVVLSVVQSLEMFFAHALRELWLLKPFMHGPRSPNDLSELNASMVRLFEKTEKFAYTSMRNAFLVAACSPLPITVREGLVLVNALPDRPPTPGDQVLNGARQEVRTLLLSLKACDAHELRNKVVHQRAYRPSREDAESAVQRVGDILIPLAHKLGIEYDSF